MKNMILQYLTLHTVHVFQNEMTLIDLTHFNGNCGLNCSSVISLDSDQRNLMVTGCALGNYDTHSVAVGLGG